jgi:hypothetical protein
MGWPHVYQTLDLALNEPIQQGLSPTIIIIDKNKKYACLGQKSMRLFTKTCISNNHDGWKWVLIPWYILPLSQMT